MRVPVPKLKGIALDWAVAKCEAEAVGATLKLEAFLHHHELECMEFSTDWAQGGPIIEREKIAIMHHDGGLVSAIVFRKQVKSAQGESPLIAAMRCYVASKLGDEVDVPGELI